MTDLVVDPDAEEEYRDLLRWYEEKRPQAADQFEAAVSRVHDLLRRFPELGARIDRRHRSHVMVGYEIEVVYRFDYDRIHIIAYAHAKLPPGYWRNRTRR